MLNAIIRWFLGTPPNYHARVNELKKTFTAAADDLTDIIEECKQADETLRAEARAISERQVVVDAARHEADRFRGRLLEITEA
jgi:SMC interacting uncharacterized protein involved in chromosome segregation